MWREDNSNDSRQVSSKKHVSRCFCYYTHSRCSNRLGSASYFFRLVISQSGQTPINWEVLLHRVTVTSVTIVTQLLTIQPLMEHQCWADDRNETLLKRPGNEGWWSVSTLQEVRRSKYRRPKLCLTMQECSGLHCVVLSYVNMNVRNLPQRDRSMPVSFLFAGAYVARIQILHMQINKSINKKAFSVLAPSVSQHQPLRGDLLKRLLTNSLD